MEISKSQINIGRFTWYFPWAWYTGWNPKNWFKIHKGSDEWHNESHYINFPPLGCFCWFTKWNGRDREEHLWFISAMGDSEGFDDPDCSICKELKELDLRWHKDG